MSEHQPAPAPPNESNAVTGPAESPAVIRPSDAAGDHERPVDTRRMPAWTVGDLPDPPTNKRGVLGILGPGLMMAGAAIGGGEWLMGPPSPRSTAA